MIDTGEALNLFAKECKRIYGADFKLEPGDELAVVLNNCVMRVSVNQTKEVKISLTPDVIKIDECLDFYTVRRI